MKKQSEAKGSKKLNLSKESLKAMTVRTGIKTGPLSIYGWCSNGCQPTNYTCPG